jgi:hypothetical protein
LEYDVVGRPRGIFAQPHVHPHQTARHEVIEGTMRIKKGGQWRVLGPGEVAETPPGTTHRHYASAADPARIRVQVRPAGRTEAWLERIAALDRAGQLRAAGPARLRARGCSWTSTGRPTSRHRRSASRRRSPARSYADTGGWLRGDARAEDDEDAG